VLTCLRNSIVNYASATVCSVLQPTTQPSWLLRLRIVEFTLDHEAPYFSNIAASVVLTGSLILCCVLQPTTQPS
jgi:hypothetical protein